MAKIDIPIRPGYRFLRFKDPEEEMAKAHAVINNESQSQYPMKEKQ